MGSHLDSVRSERTRKTVPVASKAPTLLPTLSPLKKVAIDDDVWAEMKEVAEFHTQVFEKMGARDKVSRTDLVDSFLRWACDEYWADKGGKPTSAADREKKVAAHAEKLKAEQKSEQKK